MTKPPVTSFSSLNKRQVYSLLLKLLTLFGVVILMAVLINSLWGLKIVEGEAKGDKKIESSKVMAVSLVDLQQGTMMRVLFQGQDIAILHRFDGDITGVAENETNELNESWRSIKAKYFIFINASGPTRCPLHLSADAKVLKDICSGVTYDSTGKNNRGGVERLIIPPHYFDGLNQLLLGVWKPIQK